jgi:iron complex transport system substrate-binding protein
MGRDAQADAMVKDVFQQRALVARRLHDIPEDQQVRVYMANPDLTTYGSGKYTGLMMQHAGAVNVAAKDIQGFKQVSIEDVLKWNPAVIFVQERYPDVVQQILTSPQWQAIDAVKHKRVYLMPEYAKAWGYPMPEALALGELWMAKTLYPQRFTDVDLQQHVDTYYHRYYRANCCQSGK